MKQRTTDVLVPESEEETASNADMVALVVPAPEVPLT